MRWYLRACAPLVMTAGIRCVCRGVPMACLSITERHKPGAKWFQLAHNGFNNGFNWCQPASAGVSLTVNNQFLRFPTRKQGRVLLMFYV